MKFDTEAVSVLQNEVKNPTYSHTIKILYFDPDYLCVEKVLKENPHLKGFTSKEFIEGETTFVISDVPQANVSKEGIMYLGFEDLKFVLSALFDFFVSNDKGAPMNMSLEGLIRILSGDHDARSSNVH